MLKLKQNEKNQGINYLKIRGARQNNLKNIDLDIPFNELTVITGVSGSGKSSLAFDTIYAEGQRRYVETFSPYARQFLDRMDRPKLDRIDGVLPAVAINQVNPVRTTRSTVGTMTEINDHLKLLFARMASLFCSSCGNQVEPLTPNQICDKVISDFEAETGVNQMVQIMFPIKVPENLSSEYASEYLARQGYKRISRRVKDIMYVVQDRLQVDQKNRSRIVEAIEISLSMGEGRVFVQKLDKQRQGTGKELEYSNKLRCSTCKIDYAQVTPNQFSFNSPVGACETCRGFGKTMGIDYERVIPNENLSIHQGAIRVFNSPAYRESYEDILDYASDVDFPIDTPWKKLTEDQKKWVLEGEGGWYSDKWYGVKRFFDWMEGRKHKMHVRVFLSHYRKYIECTECRGARLKADAFNWRLGTSVASCNAEKRYRHPSMKMSDAKFQSLPGLTVHDIATISVTECVKFFDELRFSSSLNEATAMLLAEVRARLQYLNDVGLGYLNLDRQSRTLSGGEVQRINLTTALGTTLVNTLFVLDEPTIGLHHRDIGRVIHILQRLSNAGNTLVVVEHEEQVMRAAQRIVDLGPGPGERGGNLVHSGTLEELMQSSESLTANCLIERSYLSDLRNGEVSETDQFLVVRGASQNNLKHIDVKFPLQQLVCVTGVSGSGKSTLVDEVLYRGICRIQGEVVDSLGKHDGIEGLRHIYDVVMVTQSPVGKTTRSNPASYIGALTFLRDKFAATDLAKSRKYSTGHFSFNSDLGRCVTCKGSGFEHIEMQFLSDVYLRCPSCNGSRFRDEVQDVKIYPAKVFAENFPASPLSIVDILELTVAEAIEFFADDPKIVRTLTPLVDVGLEYLKLGQPVPTLSGGEAQRLKLAAHVAKNTRQKRRKNQRILFLFDEPTTGLHFTDVSKLIASLRKLIRHNHSVIVIEHNLDLISCSDWIIDLGPEGGEGGGQVVAQGRPAELARTALTETGKALKEYYRTLENGQSIEPARSVPFSTRQQEIFIRNARQHNLKNISVAIPYNKLTVITGMSGSGKSTVAFDILFTEGQKRYLETINAYARQFVQPASKADFDTVSGLPPTVAIEQRITQGGQRSTVATLTEIYHYIRLLFVRFGTQYCPDCNIEVRSQPVQSVMQQIRRKYRGKSITILAPLVVSRKGFYTDLARWAYKKGSEYLLVDGKFLPTNNWPRLERFVEHDVDMPIASFNSIDGTGRQIFAAVEQALHVGKGHLRIVARSLNAGSTVRSEDFDFYSTKHSCPRCEQSFDKLDPRMFSYNSRQGWCTSCFGTGVFIVNDLAEDEDLGVNLNSELKCQSCQGERLNPVALAVKFKNMSIGEINSQTIAKAHTTFSNLKLSEREAYAAGDILSELLSRFQFLKSVGLSHLSLDRSAPTLSGGEAQRIRLAAQLGSSLCGACYVLDEPTIGLHSRDNLQLLKALEQLRDKGNTIVVVEHDEETITFADHVIDMGPGGGVRGGEVVACGTVTEIMNDPNSVTGKMLASPLQHPMQLGRESLAMDRELRIERARANNLRNIRVNVPVQALVCISGVSGSGKSTLVQNVIYRNLSNILSSRRKLTDSIRWQGCKEIQGWDQFRRVLKVDQTPIGKTPRSCPATYVNVMNNIRKLFAETAEARLRGYGIGRFSFNVADGRCPVCRGQGEKKIEMNFLADVRVKCDACNGDRYNRETLMVKYRGKSIADVLNMNIEEAWKFFESVPSLERVFRLLSDVGLGYLTLGQPSPTLSGGESQRIKLVSELAKALPRAGRLSSADVNKAPQTLYVLDEPTVGLHSVDVEKLIRVLHQLVSAGNTVVVIEHNLDVLMEADWIIDLGPEGGDGGGRIVAQGTLNQVLKSKKSYTADAMRKHLKRTTDRRVAGNGQNIAESEALQQASVN